MKDRFTEIYENNEWLHGSGEGSLVVHTGGYVKFLQRFLGEKRIRSVVDMGCGDWQFSRFIDWSDIDYMGYDVVHSVIERNRAEFARANISFNQYSGDPAELPPAELLIAKDVLQHLPNHRVLSFIPCLAKFRYALITNCINPTGATANVDIEAGDFRYLDLRLPPFNVAATEVFAFAKKMNPIRRMLRGPDWVKSVLLVDNVADAAEAG